MDGLIKLYPCVDYISIYIDIYIDIDIYIYMYCETKMTARVSKQDRNTQEVKKNPTLTGQYKTYTFSMQTPILKYKQTYNTPTNADRSEI